MVEFEAAQAAWIPSDRIMEIMREVCPRSREEVESDGTDDPDQVGVHIQNNIILRGVFDALETDGALTLGAFREVVAAARPKTEAQLILAHEMELAAVEFPVAGLWNRIGKVN